MERNRTRSPALGTQRWEECRGHPRNSVQSTYMLSRYLEITYRVTGEPCVVRSNRDFSRVTLADLLAVLHTTGHSFLFHKILFLVLALECPVPLAPCFQLRAPLGPSFASTRTHVCRTVTSLQTRPQQQHLLPGFKSQVCAKSRDSLYGSELSHELPT